MINEEVGKVIANSAFITLVTMNLDGTPHPIVAGEAEVRDGRAVFGIYKMERTQKNLTANPKAWLIAAESGDEAKGYRIIGTAAAHDKHLIFTAEKCEALL